MLQPHMYSRPRTDHAVIGRSNVPFGLDSSVAGLISLKTELMSFSVDCEFGRIIITHPRSIAISSSPLDFSQLDIAYFHSSSPIWKHIEECTMTRVLLTGGSGFIAAHVLEALLAQGHSVVTSVRSEAKAQMLSDIFPDACNDKLDFVYVADIAQEGAFDEAVKSDPPFEWVIHTASPVIFDVTDTQKDLLDPAINGTTGILKAIRKMRRV